MPSSEKRETKSGPKVIQPTSGSTKELAARPKTKGLIATKNLDLIKWIDLVNANGSIERLEATSAELNPEARSLATEILRAISSTTERPSVKFKVERIPPDSVQKLLKRVSNPFFLVSILCSVATSNDIKKLVLGILAKIELDNDSCDYVIKRLAAVKNAELKLFVWNELIAMGFLLNDLWKPHQLRFVEWSIAEGLTPNDPLEVFGGFTSAADEFENLETIQKNKVMRRALDVDMRVYVSLLLNIALGSVTQNSVEQHVGKRKLLFLHTFLDLKLHSNIQGVFELEQKCVKNMLKATLDELMTFEDLLPLILRTSLFLDLVPEDTLSRAIARVYRRGGELSLLLADRRVEHLERTVAEQATSLTNTLAQFEAERNRANAGEATIQELQMALASYEERLRGQMQSEGIGADAVKVNAKSELLSVLVEFLDPLISSERGLALEKALQKFGLRRLGEPGALYSWNSDSCETLTGEAISEGLVIRSGYTWSSEGKTILVRRVLLKAR